MQIISQKTYFKTQTVLGQRRLADGTQIGEAFHIKKKNNTKLYEIKYFFLQLFLKKRYIDPTVFLK